jgi:hypothetical protein
MLSALNTRSPATWTRVRELEYLLSTLEPFSEDWNIVLDALILTTTELKKNHGARA